LFNSTGLFFTWKTYTASA